MRLVIITHGYAPALNARAFRWTALAEHWAAAGHDVEVVTVRSGGLPRIEMLNGVRVHRVGIYLEKLGVAARQSWHSAATSSTSDSPANISSVRRGLMRLAKRIHDLTWKKVYWPDYAAPWVPSALIATRRIISSSRPTAVISVSLPFSSHLAAHFAGVFRSRIPWIVDVGDPFSFATATPVNNHGLYRGANFRAEAAVVRKSDAITVTTKATARAYASEFGHGDKITVIPPLLSIGPATAQQSAHTAANRRRLVYIGTLNRSIRNPDRLLALFGAMLQSGLAQDVHMDFFGETGDCAQSFEDMSAELKARVHVHGLVPRQRAIDAMQTALAVINIGNATTLQLPSKLVEYVASGRPIINLAAGTRDSSAQFLEGVSNVLTLSGHASLSEDARAIAKFLQESAQFENGRDACEWLANFSLETIARQYETVIKKVNRLA